MMHAIAFLGALLAFFLLAASMERSQGTMFRRSLDPARNRLLRCSGFVLLVLVLAWLVGWQGWGLGLVMFSGHTSLCAGLVLSGLILRERRQTPAGRR